MSPPRLLWLGDGLASEYPGALDAVELWGRIHPGGRRDLDLHPHPVRELAPADFGPRAIGQ